MLSHYEEMLESLFHNGRALIVFDISAFPDTAVSEWYKNFQRSVPDFLAIPTLSPYAREILVSMQRETQRHNIMIMVAEFKKCPGQIAWRYSGAYRGTNGGYNERRAGLGEMD